MPLYDYECNDCGHEFEEFQTISERHNMHCPKCSGSCDLTFKPQPRYVPFNGYFDEGLGVHITGRDHRRRVMRDLCCDFRDHPRPGDKSARRDRMHEAKKEMARR